MRQKPILDYRTLWQSSSATETRLLLATAPARAVIERLRKAPEMHEAIVDRRLPVDWVLFPGLRIQMLAPTSLCGSDADLVTFWPQWGSEVELEPASIGTVCLVTRKRQFVHRPGQSVYELVGLSRLRRTDRDGAPEYEHVDDAAEWTRRESPVVRRALDLLELFAPQVRRLGSLAIDVAAAARIWPWGVRLEALRELDIDARARLLLRHLEKLTDNPTAMPVDHEQELRRAGLIRTGGTPPSWVSSQAGLPPSLSVIDGLVGDGDANKASATGLTPPHDVHRRHASRGVSSFYGIGIAMFRDERVQSPHFHALYAGEDVSIDIESLAILAGAIQPHGLKLVRTWAKLRARELWENWERIENLQAAIRIDPLR